MMVIEWEKLEGRCLTLETSKWVSNIMCIDVGREQSWWHELPLGLFFAPLWCTFYFNDLSLYGA